MTVAFATLPASQPEPAPSNPRSRLLTTKLSAPRLRPNLVARPRLIDYISNADASLTVVSAPAGYGKSTLVTQWLIKAGLHTAWVSLDEHDNDPLDFLSLLAGAIQSIDHEIAANTKNLLIDSSPPPSSQVIVRSLLEDVSATTRSFALVLDDYHSIDNDAIHLAVGTLLQNLPPTMRVFIITRSDPPLPLARLRGRHDLLELGHEDLRFTDDEALDLLQKTNGLEMTPGEVGSLNEQAEGWVAGLQLVSFILRGQPQERMRRFIDEFSGSVRSIQNYLWEEVIGRQTPDVQKFLLHASILGRFSAPLCDAVTDGSDSASTIRLLEQARLFLVPLDDIGHWYRFHHLFADVLREHLTQQITDGELDRLHHRAAAWLEEQGFVEEAARHAVAGRDWDRAGRLLEQIGAELYEQDRVAMLCTWLQGVPPEILDRRPKLAFWSAYALSRMGRFRQATQPLRVAEQACAVDGDRGNLASLRILQAFRSLAIDVPRSVRFAQDALNLLPEDRPDEQAVALLVLGVAHVNAGHSIEAEHDYANVRVKADAARYSWLHLDEMIGSASVLVQQGKLLEATVLYRRVIKLADEQHALQSQNAQGSLGNVYVEWNMLDDAERHLRHADALAEQMQSVINRHWICLGLARVAWALGEIETAFDEVERSIEFASQMGALQSVWDGRAQQARFWLALGQVALSRRWAESCELDPYLPPTYERQFEHLTIVRLLISDDQPELALKILEPIGEHAEANRRAGDLVELWTLRALAHKSSGDNANAIEALDRALTLGYPGGYVRVFADEGESIAPLLRHASTRGNHREYAQRLLSVIEGSEAAPLSTNKPLSIDALSEREVEVLRLVSAGLPNRVIGQRLFITEKTVKKHLSNILGKLQATNRTQAVDHARRAGLV